MMEVVGFIFFGIIFLFQCLLEIVKLLLCLSPFLFSLLIVDRDDEVGHSNDKYVYVRKPLLLFLFIPILIYISARSTYYYLLNWYMYITSPDLSWRHILFDFPSKSWDHALFAFLVLLATGFFLERISRIKNPDYRGW